MKKKIIIIISIIVIGITISMLYNTLATSSTIVSNDNVYDIVLNSSNEEVVVPANSIKTILYQIENTNKGKVQYGVIYKGENITVKVYNDTIDETIGIFDYGENKFIKLCIINSGTTESTAFIKTVLGYEYGGDLIIPSDYFLVNTTYNNYTGLAKYINDLYLTHSKEIVSNNSINYNYATFVSLMNDRLGGTTTDLDGGNVRYYGASPNNYIYFNCDDYSNQTADTCELWRIIGVFNGKVKIIRQEIIGYYAYDNKTTETGAEKDTGSNDWTDARLMKLFNPGYESETVGGSLYFNGNSGSCYRYTDNNTEACDFTLTGLKNDDTRNMIEEVLWNLGQVYTGVASTYSDKMYEMERVGNTLNRLSSWNGKIALMYISDYGYATDFRKCDKALMYYDDSACYNNDYLYNGNYQLALDPIVNDYSTILRISQSGYARNAVYVYANETSRPTLFLKSFKLKDGIGSVEDPYQILN